MDEEIDLELDLNDEEIVEEVQEEIKPKFKVKVGDEELEVDEGELIGGYTRQADYTRKAQALAEERKAMDNDRKQLLEANEANAELVELDYLGKQAQEQLQMYGKVDWVAFYSDNPQAAQLERMKYEDLKSKYEEHVQYTSNRKQVLSALREQDANASLSKLSEDLQREFPNWETEGLKIANTAESVYGFSRDELNTVKDIRTIKVLSDAAKWQRYLQAKNAKAGEPVVTSAFKHQAASTSKPKLSAKAEWDSMMAQFRK